MVFIEHILNDFQMFIQDFNTVSILLRLLLAVFLGGMIGMERGRNNFGGGARTITLVCLGSCIVIIVNEYLRIKSNHTIDPARIAAQIINGVGFLGAGTIMLKGTNRVRGLTTAASLWVSAIIGIAIGCGFIFGALLGVGFTLISITVFQKYNKWYAKFDRYIELYLELDPDMGMSQIRHYAKENNFMIKSIHRKRNKPLFAEDICIELEFDTQGRRNHTSIITCLQLIEGIHYCEEI